MNPAVGTLASQAAPGTQAAERITAPRVVSIDIFRGLTMAVMIFVNELSGVRGLPWWTYHAPAKVDVMTYVDMVFPFFLFAIGMSMPLSVARRLERSSSIAGLWVHVLTRSVALIVLGTILANAEKADPMRMGMHGSTWGLLTLLCAMLYLNVYGKSERARVYSRVLRVLGFVGVIVLLAIFRRTTAAGNVAWLDESYPEILGLIGYSYFASAILYIPTRRWTWAPAIWFALLVALCAFSTARWITFPHHLPLYVWPFSNGAMCCLILAGVVTTTIFLNPGKRLTARHATYLALGFSAAALAAGRILTPLGISKIRATPTWTLYCVGAAVLMFMLLYWVCDVKQWRSWAFFVRPAGSNTLLTYLLPDLWYFLSALIGFTWLDTHFNVGSDGVARTVVFTLLMLGIAGALTKAKVRLQL
jgi:heparan-alpha-glucosaminide N-acetyltransferase